MIVTRMEPQRQVDDRPVEKDEAGWVLGLPVRSGMVEGGLLRMVKRSEEEVN